MMAMRRHGGRKIYFVAAEDAPPERIEELWYLELLRCGALRASQPERVKLLETLQGLDREQAENILDAAIKFMCAAMDIAITMGGTLRTMPATPDEDTDEGVEGKLVQILRVSAMPPLTEQNIWAMIHPKTMHWYQCRVKELADPIWGCGPSKQRPGKAGPRADPLPAELALSDAERLRLEFLRWRLAQGGQEGERKTPEETP